MKRQNSNPWRGRQFSLKGLRLSELPEQPTVIASVTSKLQRNPDRWGASALVGFCRDGQNYLELRDGDRSIEVAVPRGQWIDVEFNEGTWTILG